MRLTITKKQTNQEVWQREIRACLKLDKGKIKQILNQNNCSSSLKVRLMQGLKQTLRVKLKQVENQKQMLQAEKYRRQSKSRDQFKLTSDKDYLVVSGKQLDELVDQHQQESVRKIESLIYLKKIQDKQKKKEMKSQYMIKSSTQLPEGFYIPSAKMTTSIVIDSQGRRNFNKSNSYRGKIQKKVNKDKSLQNQEKNQILQSQQTQICSALEPIVSQARQLARRGQLLIKNLKEAHEKQIQLNLFTKTFKLKEVENYFTKKLQFYKQQSAKFQNIASEKKIQSVTTGTPDQKEKNVSDMKIVTSNSDSKKFQYQPRKNLLEEEKAFSIKIQSNGHTEKPYNNQNMSILQQVDLSPKQGRKKTEKINRPSGYVKNKSLKVSEDQQNFKLPVEAFCDQQSSKTASIFNFSQEPSKEQIAQKIQLSKKILSNKSKNLSNLALQNKQTTATEHQYSNSNQDQKGQKFVSSVMSYKHHSRIASVQNIIQEVDESKSQGSQNKRSFSSQSEEQVYFNHIKTQFVSNNECQGTQTQLKHQIPVFKPVIPQVFKNFSINQNTHLREQKKIIQGPNVSKAQNIIKNPFNSISPNNSTKVNTQNKQNNPFSVNYIDSKTGLKDNKNQILKVASQKQPLAFNSLNTFLNQKSKPLVKNPFEKFENSSHPIKSSSDNPFKIPQPLKPQIHKTQNNYFKPQEQDNIFLQKKETNTKIQIPLNSFGHPNPFQMNMFGGQKEKRTENISNTPAEEMPVQRELIKVDQPVQKVASNIFSTKFAVQIKGNNHICNSLVKRQLGKEIKQENYREETPQKYDKEEADEVTSPTEGCYTFY